MEKWAAKELSQVDLGNVRRNKRLIKIVEDIVVPRLPLGRGSFDASLYEIGLTFAPEKSLRETISTPLH
ncbi:transposase DNA-binding-containing protein [Nodularia chucula]|uniref:transposase DNA-binding-containing protein n=1 Tax=Nodularia chucula TaxID=3093667 RepID=UPI0039C66961